jgi:hypothetical protein
MTAKIYENIYIGSFIFSCGAYAGRKGYDINSSFNLYQQTPLDTKIGDVLGSVGGKSVIIEFKKDYSELQSEIKKPNRLNLLNYLARKENIEMLEISKRLHFISCPYKDSLGFLPYFFLKSKSLDSCPLKGPTLNDFLDSLFTFENEVLLDKGANNKDFIGGTYEELNLYLKMMGELSGALYKDDIMGLVVSVTKEKQIVLMPFVSLKHLQKLLVTEISPMRGERVLNTKEKAAQQLSEQIKEQEKIKVRN